MRLILLRHPETVANEKELIYGKMDYAYTKLGKRQLDWAVGLAGDMTCSRIITSPLGRARHLALAIGSQWHLPVTDDPDLEEMGYGILEGLTLPEAKERYPEVVEAFFKGEEDVPIPDGEGFTAFESRVCRSVDRYLAAGEDVLLVSHGGVVRTAVDYLLDADSGFSWNLEIGNVSFVEFECVEGYHKIINLRNYEEKS